MCWYVLVGVPVLQVLGFLLVCRYYLIASRCVDEGHVGGILDALMAK